MLVDAALKPSLRSFNVTVSTVTVETVNEVGRTGERQCVLERPDWNATGEENDLGLDHWESERGGRADPRLDRKREAAPEERDKQLRWFLGSPEDDFLALTLGAVLHDEGRRVAVGLERCPEELHFCLQEVGRADPSSAVEKIADQIALVGDRSETVEVEIQTGPRGLSVYGGGNTVIAIHNNQNI